MYEHARFYHYNILKKNLTQKNESDNLKFGLDVSKMTKK
jgi:hypothetical protein